MLHLWGQAEGTPFSGLYTVGINAVLYDFMKIFCLVQAMNLYSMNSMIGMMIINIVVIGDW